MWVLQTRALTTWPPSLKTILIITIYQNRHKKTTPTKEIVL